MHQGFNPPGVWQPFGSFSLGVVHGEGRIVPLCGQIPWDEYKRIAGKGNIQLQTKQRIENIKTVLPQVSGALKGVSSLTLYVTDLTNVEAIDKIRSEYFGKSISIDRSVDAYRNYRFSSSLTQGIRCSEDRVCRGGRLTSACSRANKPPRALLAADVKCYVAS